VVPAKAVTSAVGRLSDDNKAILDHHFKRIEDIIVEASNETSLPTHQVLALWKRQSTRTNQNLNVWNAYQKYFVPNAQEEIARLSQPPSKPLQNRF
jgi:hypothetical protein